MTREQQVVALGIALIAGATVVGFAERHPLAPDQGAQNTGKSAVTFRHDPNVLHIDIGGQPFADYVYASPDISRPYFAHVRTPAGIQVTRNRPPDPASDLTDHPTLHPGIWLAFGDLSGHDYWRLKAKVEHEMFTSAPAGGQGRGGFAVRNFYLATGGSERVAAEEATYTIHVVPAGYLLEWDSTFTPYGDREQIVFGDQEEMGLGIRVQTRLAEQFGGVLTDAAGRRGAKEIWSKSADWLDYSGTLEGKWLGITLMPHPDNFRDSWYHARDYGFTAANPFGREAMKAGPKSEVVVKKGEKLRLRFGVLLHSSESAQDVDIPAAYRTYLKLAGGK